MKRKHFQQTTRWAAIEVINLLCTIALLTSAYTDDAIFSRYPFRNIWLAAWIDATAASSFRATRTLHVNFVCLLSITTRPPPQMKGQPQAKIDSELQAGCEIKIRISMATVSTNRTKRRWEGRKLDFRIVCSNVRTISCGNLSNPRIIHDAITALRSQWDPKALFCTPNTTALKSNFVK